MRDLIAGARQWSAQGKPASIGLRVPLDQHRCDQRALRAADDKDRVNVRLDRLDVGDQVVEVGLRLFDGVAVLVVAAGRNAEPEVQQLLDQLPHVRLAQFLRQSEWLLRFDVPVSIDDQGAIEVRRQAGEDQLRVRMVRIVAWERRLLAVIRPFGRRRRAGNQEPDSDRERPTDDFGVPHGSALLDFWLGSIPRRL